VPGLFDETVRNLREIAPTAYFNVPKGFEMLLPVLRDDAAFRRHFFSRLQILFYAAAGLRQEVADAFVDLSTETLGARLPWVTGLGATESAPFALCTGAQQTLELKTSKIGVPVPGVELKAAPVGDRLEARLRGPNVTPGYWRDDALTAAAFDEDGYYRMGDAVALADPAEPLQGFVFQGRIAEDFKLSTGTWVWVGPIRARLLAALGDLAQDVVITGHDRDFVGALIFPNLRAWRALVGADDDLPVSALLRDPAIIADLRRRLEQYSADRPGSSTAIRRAIMLEQPPSLDAREITDKGSINQRAVLTRRAAIVDRLYGDAESAAVIEIVTKEQNA
jgi:feruloyl-CoA synthase